MRGRLGKPATVLSLGAVLALAVTAAGCASSHTTVVAPPGATVPTSGNWKEVRYSNVVFEVPSAWPVIDLTANPRRCALFDVHAAYLGHQGAEAVCPAQAIGRTDAVQVEPFDTRSQPHLLPSAAVATIHGQRVVMQPDASATLSVVASFSRLGVTVTATYLGDPATANRIVDSVQSASGSS